MTDTGFSNTGVTTVASASSATSAVAGTAPGRPRPLVLGMNGDSVTADYNFRAPLHQRLIQDGDARFVGVLGMPPNGTTGGRVGSRVLGDWRHDGHAGRRQSDTFAGTADPSTNQITAAGHNLADGVAFTLHAVAGTLGGIAAGQVYYARDVSGDTFRAATYQGGAAVDITGTSGAVTVGTGLLELWAPSRTLYDAAPTVVLLRGATNDFFAGRSAATALTAMGARINAVRATDPAAAIVVCSPPPVVPGSVSGVGWATIAAERDTYVAGLPALCASKGSNVAFLDSGSELGPATMSSDGIHPTPEGYNLEALFVAEAVRRIVPGFGPTDPRDITSTTAQAAVTLVSASSYVGLPYAADLSPASASFLVGVEYWPTTLETDGNLRVIAGYGTAHPSGFMIGHLAPSGNGGGLAVYLGASGAPVVIGNINTAYAWEALRLEAWNSIYVLFDRAKLLCAVWVGNPPEPLRLVVVAPISAAWAEAATAVTRLGARGPFPAALGHVQNYFVAKGVSLADAYKVIGRHYYDRAAPDQAALYPLDEGTGTSVAPTNYALSAGSIAGGATWLAAGSIVTATVPHPTSSVKTSAYTAQVGELVLCDPSGGAFQVTLPLASRANKGRRVGVKNTTASTNQITVARSGSQLIDAATSASITQAYACLEFASTGAGWVIV
jgi:lysophospholipase L1-like esterase